MHKLSAKRSQQQLLKIQVIFFHSSFLYQGDLKILYLLSFISFHLFTFFICYFYFYESSLFYYLVEKTTSISNTLPIALLSLSSKIEIPSPKSNIMRMKNSPKTLTLKKIESTTTTTQQKPGIFFCFFSKLDISSNII